jgi:hypothetical protein
MNDATATAAPRVPARFLAATLERSELVWRLGVATLTAGVAAFLFIQLSAWPPHEDETLALFTGRGSVHDLIRTVLGERGGAPLHFLFAWVVAHTGGGLMGLRVVSAVFAIGSVPLIALLVARLADRAVALVATALVAPSWMLLFHGVYGRMYSMFLFTTTLSYLALLSALARRDRRGWILWALAMVACIATHPYGALVLGSQGLYVLYARQVRQALPAFVAVFVLAIPMWSSDRVLASRFDVGVGGGGAKLGGPASILQYLVNVSGDFTAGWLVPRTLVLLVALAGLVLLARWRRAAAASGCWTRATRTTTTRGRRSRCSARILLRRSSRACSARSSSFAAGSRRGRSATSCCRPRRCSSWGSGSTSATRTSTCSPSSVRSACEPSAGPAGASFARLLSAASR